MINKALLSIFVLLGTIVIGEAARLPLQIKDPRTALTLSTLPPTKAPLENHDLRNAIFLPAVSVFRGPSEITFVVPVSARRWAPLFLERIRLRLYFASTFDILYSPGPERLTMRSERSSLRL